MRLINDQHKLLVFIEGRKRKEFVGVLNHAPENNSFIFLYEKKYLINKSSIALGPDIPLSKIRHESK